MRPNPVGERLPRVVEGEVVTPSGRPAAQAPTGPTERPTEHSTHPDAKTGAPIRGDVEATGAAPARGPRVAILSLREVRPLADFGGLHEAEDVLRETLSAWLYRVVLASPRFTRSPFNRGALRRALSSSRLVHPFRIEHHGRDAEPADVLLVLARDLRDAATLACLPEWHTLGHKVVVHLSVVTERALRRYGELVRQLRRRVDALFSGSEMPPLGHLRSDRLRTVGVIPPLLDVLAFSPRPADQRTIDVFSPGPHQPGQHQLLSAWARARHGRYQHDIGQLGAITSADQYRRIFITKATRSRVFLTNYEQFGHRRHTGAHREVGPRFYEAMAAGCALAGDLPASSWQFREHVADARPLSFPIDATGLPREVATALADPAESERLGRAARITALRRNDVAHRWQTMAELAEIPVSPGIEARIGQLAQLAAAIEAGHPEPSGPDVGGGYRD